MEYQKLDLVKEAVKMTPFYLLLNIASQPKGEFPNMIVPDVPGTWVDKKTYDYVYDHECENGQLYRTGVTHHGHQCYVVTVNKFGFNARNWVHMQEISLLPTEVTQLMTIFDFYTHISN